MPQRNWSDDTELQNITKLYWEQSAVVRTESGLTAECKIKKGVPTRVCPFIQLIQFIHRKIFKEVQDMKGVTLGGINLNNLGYVDDTALLCFCPNDLQKLIHAVNKAGKP